MPAAKSLANTTKYQRFVASYVACLNARTAAIEAGFSPRSAHVKGHMLLKKPDVLAAIAAAQTKLQVRTEITQDRVLAELALLAFSSVDHYEIDDFGKVTLAKDAPAGAIRAVASIKYRVTTDDEGRVERTTELKLWDKPGPLKTAGKHVGLFNENQMSKEQLDMAVDQRIAELREQARLERERGSIAVQAVSRTHEE